MVITGQWEGHSLTVSARPNCLTLSIEGQGDGRQARVFSYDYAGRLWTAMQEGVSYRRGLDGKVIARWQVHQEAPIPMGRRSPEKAWTHGERRWLSPQEARALVGQAARLPQDLLLALQSGQVQLDAPLPEQAHQGLLRAAAFDARQAEADAARYHQVYRPVGILPPDQYMAVVLQATEGCAFNTCTFCTFYKERPFRIQEPEEFRGHAEAVRAYLGDGMSLRRTVFLGDANALVVPQRRLLPMFDVVHAVYDVEQLGGIYAFLDGFSGEKKTPSDYAALAERGLKRVYIGLESGSEALLKFLKKPGKPADAVQAARAMKAGGVAVGVIVLLGAGGQTYAKDHVRQTIQALNAMHLDLEDLIYFSELVEDEGMPYVRDAFQAQLRPLSGPERAAQQAAIERGLKFSPRDGEPHISRYDVREFVY